MKSNFLWRAWILAVLLGLVACATTKTPYHETPPSQLIKEDQALFLQALDQQKKGQIQTAVDLWQKFLKQHPRSYEAHNNLGMSYYANDQLTLSIDEFEKALDLEPNDAKVKENLIRALKFETTLLTENKEYDKAVENWETIAELSPAEKEKISYKIEELQDKIFDQTKRSNTLDDYKSFLERYPESPHAAEAQKKVDELGREHSGVIGFDTPEAKVSPSEGPLTMGEVGEMSAPPAKLQEEITPDKKAKMEARETSPAETKAPPAPAAPPPAMTADQQKKAEETKAKEEGGKNVKAKKIKIASKSPLRVRATPALKGKVLTRLKNNTAVVVLQEKDGWYKIQFGKGKTGWISKKYTKPAE